MYETALLAGLIFLGIVVLLVAVLIVLELVHQRRESREEEQRRRRFGGAAAVVLLALLLPGCSTDELVTPTVVATPSPSPTPDPRCVIAFCTIVGDEVIAGLGENQPRSLLLNVYNATNTPVETSCNIPRRAGWHATGPVRTLGDTTSFTLRYYATAAGEASFTATVGNSTCPFKVAIRE